MKPSANPYRRWRAHLRSLSPLRPPSALKRLEICLKKLYQYLVPKQLRHDLGEYYTPDWLAERLLNQLGL